MRSMKTKLCLAALVLLPSLAVAECVIDDGNERQLELLETVERAWVEYRNAACELIAERDDEALKTEAMATCLEFYVRQLDFELQLMSRVLTFTNVRSILAAE